MQRQHWSHLVLTIAMASLFVFANASMATAQTQALPKKTKKSKTVDTTQSNDAAVTVGGTTAPAVMAEESTPDTPVQAPTSYNGQPVFQFNTKGASANTDREKRNNFQFKIVTDEKQEKDKTMADPVNNIPNDEVFKVYPGYPKYDLLLALGSKTVGFKQTLTTGQDLNFSTTSVDALDLTFRMDYTPEVFFELGYGSYSVSSPAKTGAVSTLDSKAMASYFAARSYMCWIGSSFFNRFCPGLEIAQDAFPGFVYSGGNSVKLDLVTDYTIGAIAHYQHSFILNTLFTAKLGYHMGLKQGQKDYLSVTSNSKIVASGAIDKMFNEKHGMNVLLNYEYRSYTLSGSVNGTTKDNMSTTAGNMGLNVGYRYQF